MHTRHTSFVAVVTPNYRPKWARNRCESEVLVTFSCCHFAVWSFLLV